MSHVPGTYISDFTLSPLTFFQSPRRIKRRVAVESEDDEHSIQDVRIKPQMKRARRTYASSYADEMVVNDEDLSKAKEQRKRTAVFTSDEDEEFVDEPETPILEDFELSDGDYEAPSVARSRSLRQRTMSWKAKEAGGGALIKGKQPAKGKVKGKKEPEIRMKDERNRADTPPIPKAKSRPKSESKDEDIDMDLGVDVNDSPSAHKKEAPASPLKNEDSMLSFRTPPESTPIVSGPAKKKLPPIRKNKPAEGNPTTPGTSTSTPVHKQSQSQTSKPPLDKDKGVPRPPNKPGTSTLPNKPKLTAAGQPEINLSDKGVWDSMFKGVHFLSYGNRKLLC